MEASPHIPVKSMHSLIGFLPLIGIPVSITAFVLGILALRYKKRTYVPGAKTHAIIAIALGSVLGSIHILLSVYAQFNEGKS